MVITMAVSAAVAVLVVFLKPIADDWFDHKKRRIVFRTDRAVVTKSPLPQVKLKFGEYEFDEVFGYDAAISNSTGRTLRNTTFEVWSSPGKPADGFCRLTCEGAAIEPTIEDDGVTKWKIHRDEIGREQKIAVYVIATVEQNVMLRTSDDLEIYNVISGPTTNIARLGTLQTALGGLSWAAIAATVSALIGLLLK